MCERDNEEEPEFNALMEQIGSLKFKVSGLEIEIERLRANQVSKETILEEVWCKVKAYYQWNPNLQFEREEAVAVEILIKDYSNEGANYSTEDRHQKSSHNSESKT